jgi:hypothetical protein
MIKSYHMSDPTIDIFCSLCSDFVDLDLAPGKDNTYERVWVWDDQLEEELKEEHGWEIHDGDPICPRCVQHLKDVEAEELENDAK